ncbi:hypothetical protein BDB01DRAFT_427905 [Pilobolus umbonatus]|nr:hypothetical protein BDB01DRAFT_427905 [Pilobolus umbonatus]
MANKFRVNKILLDYLFSVIHLYSIEWHQPALSENHDYALAQLYSSNDDIYRIFLFGIEKAANELFITITITDNATSTEGGWTERERGASNYTIYENDPIDYSGYDDMSNYYPEPVDKDYMPQLGISKWALSADSKTIVLPYIKNKLLTLDYTDRIDILQQIEKERKHLYTNSTGYLNEYYYWQDAELTYADISGVQLDEEGDRLAVWTEYNDVYLYDRYANTTVITKPSLSEMVNHWLESYMTNTTETEEELIQKYLPSKWKLSMVITEGGIIPIAYAHFFHDMISHGNYLFIALKNGQVYAYHMDQLEQPKIVNFKTLLFEKWDMLMAMSMIIFIFVYNEYSIFTY